MRSILLLGLVVTMGATGCGGADEGATGKRTLMMAVEPISLFVFQDGSSAQFAITYEGTAQSDRFESFGAGPPIGMAWPAGLEFHSGLVCTGPTAAECPLPRTSSFTATSSTQGGYYFFQISAGAGGASASTLMEVIVTPPP